MVKRKLITAILLFFLLLTSISCSKKNKADSWYNLAVTSGNAGDVATQKDAILLYMLTSTEAKDRTVRDEAVRIYTLFEFPDALNTLLLKPDDVLEGRITLYKSYAALGQTQAANDVLETSIHGYLPTTDYVTLVINYPTDSDYTASVLLQWLSSVRETDKDDFSSLLQQFCRTDISENALKTVLLMTEKMESDPYYSQDDLKLSKIYKTKAITLEKLYDKSNAARYWDMAYNKNPQDSEASDKQ